MHRVTDTFARIERKYLLTRAQAQALFDRVSGRVCPDEYGHSTIRNVYLDTPDFRMIRTSVEATVYKEKLRLRCYGVPHGDKAVFLEIKKKFDGVVYKRRLALPLAAAERYIDDGDPPAKGQIMDELEYAMRFWQRPKAAVVLCYEREAFFAADDRDLRLTFDTGVRYRTSDLSLTAGDGGKYLLDDDTVLLEIKIARSLPLWLSAALTEQGLYPVSFSKYGAAYRDLLAGVSARPDAAGAAPDVPTKGEYIHA